MITTGVFFRVQYGNLGCDANLKTTCPVEERSACLIKCLMPSVNVTSRRLLLFVGTLSHTETVLETPLLPGLLCETH